jgi:hypothetical protein
MATGTMAFGRGSGGGGGGGHFGGGEAEVILAGVSGAVILAAAAVLPAVSGAVTSAEALGAALAPVRVWRRFALLRPRQLLRPHALRLRLGLQLKSVVSFGGASLIGLICK